MNKMFFKIVSTILVLSMLISMIPKAFAISAEENADRAGVASEPLFEPTKIGSASSEVNWLDVVYGYPSYLQNNDAQIQQTAILNLCEEIYNDFSGTDTFWASLEYSLANAGSIKKLITSFTDAMGYTSVIHDKAADQAVIQIMKTFYADQSSSFWSTVTSTSSKALSAFDQSLTAADIAYDMFGGDEVLYDFETFDLTQVQIGLKYFLEEVSLATTTVDATALNGKIVATRTVLVDDVFQYYKDTCSTLEEALKIAKTFASILFMMNIEDELVEYLLGIPFQSEILKALERLKKDINSNFITYFYRSYIQDGLIDRIVKSISDDLFGKTDSDAKLVSIGCKLSQWLFFDVVFPVADAEDILVYMYLSSFAYSMKLTLDSKIDYLASNPINNHDVEDFEYFYPIYAAGMKSMLSFSANINPSNSQQAQIESALLLFDSTKTRNAFTLNGYKEFCISSVAAIPEQDRVERQTDSSKTYTLRPKQGNWAICESAPTGNYSAWIYSGTGKVYYGVVDEAGMLDASGNIDIFPTERHETLTICGLLKMRAGRISVKSGANVTITGNCAIERYWYSPSTSVFEIQRNAFVTVNRDFTLPGDYNERNPELSLSGTMEVKGKVTTGIRVGFNVSGSLVVGGNVSLETNPSGSGTVVLNGTSAQTINGTYYNLTITNSSSSGVSASGKVYIKNCFNNQASRISGNFRLSGGYLAGPTFHGTIYTDKATFKESVTIQGSLISDYGNATTIRSGVEVYVTGGMTLERYYLADASNLTVEEGATLTVGGNISVTGWSGTGATANLNIYGTLHAKGNITCSSYGYINSNNNAVICLCGSGTQTVSGVSKFKILIIDKSSGSVSFASAISVSTLFDHRGNSFSLYRSGSGSSFVDYDGDGMKDNVDPDPTAGVPCTITVQSENTEKGTVSTETIETFGGASVTVSAAPTFKYEFSKWVDGSGKTVSTSPAYTFVAKSDVTLTAVFVKRTRAITTAADGGTITTPSKAEIESTVTVSMSEDDGYIYQEGSLCCNGTPIENNSFVMPDEDVTLTAIFLRNEAYFALADAISAAENCSFEDYTIESFDSLQKAISAAQTALTNQISQVESDKQIAALETAKAALELKTATRIEVTSVPTVYVGVDGMIDGLCVQLVYNNGTADLISDFTVSGFDVNQLGTQTITISYNEFEVQTDITVQQRNFSGCKFAAIPQQTYQGNNTPSSPTLTITYTKTGEVLTEGTDYTAEYSNNTYVGTATVTVTGIGNYSGTLSKTFKIVCNHEYEQTVDIEPTCTEVGLATYVCAICGDTYDVEHDALGHDYASTVTKEATCTEYGEMTYTCANCGEIVLDQTAIPPIGHSYVDGVCTVCDDETDVYALVTSLDQLYDGCVIVFGSAAKNAVSGNLYSTNRFLTVAAEASIADGYAFGSDIAEITLNAVDGGWTMSIGDSDIKVSAKDFSLCGDGDEATVWNINITSDGTAIVSVPGSDPLNRILYNVGSPRFKPYTSTTSAAMLLPEIYIKDSTDIVCEHANTEIRDAKTATCTEAGYTGDIYCLNCGKKITAGKMVAALGHIDEDNNIICDWCGSLLEAYTLSTTAPVAGKDYIIVAESEGRFYALDNTENDVGQILSCTEVFPENGTLVCSGDYAFSAVNAKDSAAPPNEGVAFMQLGSETLYLHLNSGKIRVANMGTNGVLDFQPGTTENTFTMRALQNNMGLSFDGSKFISKANTISDLYFYAKDPAAMHEHAYAWDGIIGAGGSHTLVCSCGSSKLEDCSFSDGACSVCGACELIAPIEIKSAALRIDENINLIYAAEIPDGCEDPYMVIDFLNGSYRIEDYTVNGDGLYCFEFKKIIPIYMGESITATAYATKNGETVSDVVANYSIKDYCVSMIEKNPDNAALKTLLSDILVYGAAAQNYTGYKTDALVTNGLELSPSTFTALDKQTATFTGEQSDDIDWTSATVCLSNELGVRFYFIADSVDGLTVDVSIGSRTETFDADDFGVSTSGKYFVTLRDIKATEFDEAVTASFKQGGMPIGRTVSYSVNTYICGTQNSDNANLQTLVRALYNYGASAKAYANK